MNLGSIVMLSGQGCAQNQAETTALCFPRWSLGQALWALVFLICNMQMSERALTQMCR